MKMVDMKWLLQHIIKDIRCYFKTFLDKFRN